MTQFPDALIAALEAQITEQFNAIVRYRKLKNDAIEESLRQKHEAEILLCMKNIDEIRQGFLTKAQATEAKPSNEAIYQKTQEVVTRVVVKIEGEQDVANLGDIANQINHSQIGTLNVYHYHAPPPLTPQNVVPYYEATNQRNYQGVILSDPQGMRLDQIYVEPSFSCHHSCFEGLSTQSDEANEFIGLNQTISANHFLNQLLLVEGATPLFTRDISKQKLQQSRLFFLLGMPGQGKTSFCHRLFYDLTTSPNLSQYVFYVRLRDLPDEVIKNPKKLIFERIAQRIKKHANKISLEETDLCNSILILDGLDELAMVSQENESIAREFCRNLQRWVEDEFYDQLKIIVTSRLHYLDFDKVNGSHAPTFIMKLEEFRQGEQREWIEKFGKVYPDKFTLEHLEEYNQISPHTKAPKYKNFSELLRLPILLYFIAQIEEPLTEDATRAQIYEKVFDVVLKRTYDDGVKVHHPTPKDQEGYRLFLQQLAFDIFATGTDFIPKRKIEIPSEVRQNQHNMLANFYFRELKTHTTPDDYHEGAIEFLHKSLQEYLTAEKVKEALKIFAQAKETPTSEPPREGFEALHALFGRRRFSTEIGEYLVELLNNLTLSQRQQIALRLGQIFPYLVANDFMCHYENSPTPHLSPLAQSRAFCYNFWWVLSHLEEGKDYMLTGLGDWLDYLRAINVEGLALKHQSFEGADLSGSYLGGALLQQANLSACMLTQSNLRKAQLYGANLQEADLSHSNLIETDLREANLAQATLVSATFFEASLQGANLSGANLKRVNLNGAHLDDANLQEAGLQKARLNSSFLIRAHLQQADLTEAELGGVYLNKAAMTQADLTKAHLRGANLQQADLTDAMAKEADAREADLQKANLTGANLYQANLYKANLQSAQLVRTLLQRADMSYCDLSRTIFDGVDLTQTRLDGAILTNTSFSQARMTQAQYDEAKAQHAKLDDDTITIV